MKYINLGNTDIKVSRICVGGMSFGEPSEDFHLWTINQEQTTATIKHALELGVNFIDTANCYSHGTSETYIGNALKELGVKREDVVLASKVYFNEGKLSKEAIFREIEGTLKRLQTDYLDLYQIHRFDYDTPIEETMEALDELVKSGKVRAIGASAMYGYQFHNMQEVALKNGWTLFSTMQNHYNLMYREDEREMIPICNQFNVSRISYSPLAGGHLAHTGWTTNSKRSQTDKTLKRKYDQTMKNDLEINERVEEVAKKYGVSMTQIALAWQFKKGVAAPIVGATNYEHFDDAVKAVDLDLKDEDVKYLEEIYDRHKIVGALPEE
ncbi:MAG: aldo/keto reductase [Thomasclavelia sp.]|jgi:aryl-alcohol dehydrogenase-like predicted oxidoreductase|nr:aldo/keto reductase [Thomasclavelia sp.]